MGRDSRIFLCIGTRDPLLDYFLRIREDSVVQSRVFFVGEGEEDEIFRRDVLFRPADTDTDTEEILRTESVDDVGDAIVSGGRGRRGTPECAFRYIEIVVDDCESFFVQFVISQEVFDRLSGEIHIGLRLSEEYLVPIPFSLGEE